MGQGVSAVLRFNMSGRAATPEGEAERYQAALDMAAWADEAGFAVVNVEEHHDSEIGWLGSPLVMAGLIVPRTRRVQIRASALLVTLYDPLRLAEDIALLDLASRGRFLFVVGQGYRPAEYHMFDRDWDGRGAQTEFILETLLKAWSGQPFDYRGRTVHVSPQPYSRPHPPFHYGGMSPVAAKRAARFGLPFFPAQPMPELEALYRAECARIGTRAEVVNHHDLALLLIDEDPDRAWAELGPYLLRETQQYSAWTKGGVARAYESGSQSVEELRRQGTYAILTPDQCLEQAARAHAAGRDWQPILHPLAGGIPPERGWHSLTLFAGVLRRLGV
jgi:alkanesulfonate monooxygenase SsuD/methylene tetrahydromethanopterin reductase-like flavin-dependent oxidoreductase (luciferase family)